jgi:hypothetical protein
MNQTVGHGTVCHALDAEAVGGSHAGDIGENGTADGDLTLFRLELDHENVLSFFYCMEEKMFSSGCAYF